MSVAIEVTFVPKRISLGSGEGKLSEFILKQNIPEQEDDVPLERAGACGLPRVPEPELTQNK